MENKNFLNVAAADGFIFQRHNATDFESFKDFHSELEERYAKIEKEKERETRRENLKSWEEGLPRRWRGASLKTMEHKSARVALKNIHESPRGSHFIQGPSGSGKTYIGYGIVRRLIGLGVIRPSQIKIVTEETILSYAMNGFNGREKFNELLNSRYQLYFIDDIGMRETYTPKELTFVEQLIDHIYSNSLIAIFTSGNSARSFAGHLSGSAQSKFRHIVDGKILKVEGSRAPELDDWTEEEMSQRNRILKEKEVLDGFAD